MNRYEKFLKEHQGKIQEICEELLDEFGEDYEEVECIYFSITMLGMKFKLVQEVMKK